MRAFEIHTFQGGKWKIDSVFDDRDLAVFEAQRMEGSKRYAGVRVIEETFDESTQHTSTRTIYKGTCVDQAPAMDAAKRQPASSKAAKAAPRSGAPTAARRPAAKAPAGKAGNSTGLMVALFSIIVIVGLGAVVALRLLSSHM